MSVMELWFKNFLCMTEFTMPKLVVLHLGEKLEVGENKNEKKILLAYLCRQNLQNCVRKFL